MCDGYIDHMLMLVKWQILLYQVNLPNSLLNGYFRYYFLLCHQLLFFLNIAQFPLSKIIWILYFLVFLFRSTYVTYLKYALIAQVRSIQS